MKYWISVLLALLAIIVPTICATISAYDIFARGPYPEKQLQLESFPPVDPLVGAFLADALKASYTIDGRSVDNILIAHTTITNVGRSPIVASDFFEPLRVSVKAPWQILSIKNSYPSSAFFFNWKRINDTSFEAEPTLVNPTDQISADIFLTNSAQTAAPSNARPEMTWRVRIPNMKELLSPPNSYERMRAVSTGGPNIRISLGGWAVFAVLALCAMSDAALLFLLWHAGYLRGPKWVQLLLALGATILSVCAAEATVTVLIGDPFTAMIGINYALNLPIIYAQLVAIVFLAIRAFQLRRAVTVP